MRIASIHLLLSLAASAQGVRYGCTPTPDVATAISRVAGLRLREPSEDVAWKAREILRPLVLAHPSDVFANLEYLSLHRGIGHDEIIRGYRLAMEAHEGDPRYALFYAASLIGNNTQDALRRLTALASAEFPYPYLLIGQIHSYPKFRDNAALSTNLIRFVQACPSHLPAYALLAASGSGEELGAVAVRLRAELMGRLDAEAVTAYRWLWPIEFRVTPAAGHAALRLRIAQDIEELGLTGRMQEPEAVAALREAYRSIGNDQALRALPAPAERLPAVYAAERQWRSAHPVPGREASQEEAARYYRALAEEAQSWLTRWPDEPMPYLRRLSALAKLPDSSEAELSTAGEQLISVQGRRPGRHLRNPAVLDVAKVYVERGMRLDSVPGMVEVGLRAAEETRVVAEYDFLDDRNHRVNEEARYLARILGRTVHFEWAAKTAKLESASEALDAMRKDLDAVGPVATQKGTSEFLDAEYRKMRARLAELEGHSGTVTDHRRPASEAKNQTVGATGQPEVAKAAGLLLPPFRAEGLDGRVWTAADLNGKVTVLHLWATWCAPCIEELPYIQTLYEKLQKRNGVVLLSVNVDANPGVVAPFLQGKGWTFPVVLAHDYVEQVLPDLGIPRTWVVESGIVRSEEIGFEAGPGWQARLLSRIEEARPRR